MKPRFTPGPWNTRHWKCKFDQVFKHGREFAKHLDYFVVTGPKHIICETPSSRDNRTKTEEIQANAHLIAAAPEMYDILDRLNDAIFKVRQGDKIAVEVMQDFYEEIENTLKKARGDQ